MQEPKKKLFNVAPYPNVEIEKEIFKRYRKDPRKLSEKELLILILAELRDLEDILRS